MTWGVSLKNIAKVRVIYADTDAMGIVYHTNYIKWFEVGRAELLRTIGLVYASLAAQGFYLPLTEVNCHYLASARYDQILLVETEIDYVRRASVKFLSTIWDEMKEKVLVEGYTVHAFTNGQGKVTRFPPEIIEKLKPHSRS
jgi:acyl-CoA thioester hydrolase